MAKKVNCKPTECTNLSASAEISSRIVTAISKFVSRICKHQVSIKIEDEALMSVEFLMLLVHFLVSFWLSAIFTILFSFKFHYMLTSFVQ